MAAPAEWTSNSYPGATAHPEELMALADQFQLAADEAIKISKRGHNISLAPFRLLCIHAIELYLNAFLLHCGEPASAIRSLQHDLAARLDLLDKYKLVLKAKTRCHLTDISANREYVVSRYAPDVTTLSQVNRLQATVAEVESKVRARLTPASQAKTAKSAKAGRKPPAPAPDLAPAQTPQLGPRQLDLLSQPSGVTFRWRLAL